MQSDDFDIIKNARGRLPSVCAEVYEFARIEASIDNIKPGFMPPPLDEDSRLFAATLEGYLNRHVKLFGAIISLEKMGYRDEWLMLSRTLFEVSVDANYLWNIILQQEDPIPTLQKIRYSYTFNEMKLLRDSEHITKEQLHEMKSKIVKVPGLTVEEHKAIEARRNFTGLDMLERCKKTEAGPYYKPIFGRLSKYAHGMTYDWEMAFAQQKPPEKLIKREVTEEALNLMHCALLVLIGLKYLCVVTGRNHDATKADALQEKLGMLFETA
jgi:hypothetical protein